MRWPHTVRLGCDVADGKREAKWGVDDQGWLQVHKADEVAFRKGLVCIWNDITGRVWLHDKDGFPD